MLSIIVPVYNVEKYLEECVNSLLPIKSEIEIILVDDGSTDSSGKICDELKEKDKRIKVIHRENGGLSAARNTGIKNASGKYVMFLDSDDFIDLKEFEAIEKALFSDCDAIVGLYRNYFSDTNRRENENAEAFLKKEGVLTAGEFLKLIPEDGRSCYMIACRFIVKREILLKNQGELLFMQGIYHEDEEWTQRLLTEIESVYLTHSYFYIYRQAREGAITFTVKPKAVWDTITVMEHAFKEREKHKTTAYKYEYLSLRAAQQFINVILKAEVLEKSQRKEVYNILKKYKKTCMPYFRGKEGKLTVLALNIFGVSLGATVLQKMRNLKNKINK